MHTGRDMAVLTSEIRTIADNALDILPTVGMLEMHTAPDSGLATISIEPAGDWKGGEFVVGDVPHGQIANDLGIHGSYYRRMREVAPSLLETNVNHWFQHDQHANRRKFIRTVALPSDMTGTGEPQNKMRAYLGSTYRPLDTWDLLVAVQDVLGALPDGFQVASADLTESRFYLKVVSPRHTAEVRIGDTVQFGVAISTSDVGVGSVQVDPFSLRLVCLNGMTHADHALSLRQRHIGRHIGGDDPFLFYSDETRRLDDQAFFAKVKDVVRGTLDWDRFQRILQEMQDATKKRVEGSRQKIVEVVGKTYAFSDVEREKVLDFWSNGDRTVYDLAQAVTRTAQDVKSYDRASQLETIGGQILRVDPRSISVN